MSIPRSSLYYQSQKRDDQPIRKAIQTAAGSWPRYGSERIAAQFKRDGVTFHGKPIGEQRTRQLMREMGLLAKPHPRKPRTTDSNHAFPRFLNLVKGLSVTQPDQVWVSDVTYIRLGSGFVYLAVIMDVRHGSAVSVFTRARSVAPQGCGGTGFYHAAWTVT